jgi:hypothetical protein
MVISRCNHPQQDRQRHRDKPQSQVVRVEEYHLDGLPVRSEVVIAYSYAYRQSVEDVVNMLYAV